MNAPFVASRPRLLLVGGAAGGGGAENRFRLLLRHIFGGTARGATLHTLPTEADDLDGRLVSLGWRHKRDYAASVWRLRQLLKSQQFDAALSLGLYPNAVLAGAGRALRNRPTLILTEITRPHAERALLTSPFAKIVRPPLARLSYSAADRVAANSEQGVAELAEHYGVDRARLRRVPNLVDAARLRALAGSSARPEVPRLCMVGRFDPIKRVDTLIRALNLLGTDRPWHLDLVGDGPHRPAILTLINKLGLTHRVTLHGWLENPWSVMAAATATVLCSDYEGFSNTVLESMVLGTPVITSLCSTDASQMVAAGAALGFETGNADALCRALTTLLDTPALADSLRLAATHYAARHHLAAAIVEYEALVMDAIMVHRA